MGGPGLLDLPLGQPERRTAHQLVRDTLRRAILSGALPGGTRLVQAELAAQLKVSTTPVREALRDLAADGLILFDPHRGAIVHELDMAELVEVYEIRTVLEPLAIRKAAERITDEELRAAAALLKQLEAVRDPGEWVDLNWQFHSLVERAARSPRLLSMVKTTQDSAAIYVAHSIKLQSHRIAQGNREHRALLAALRHHQPEVAAELLVKHLDGTLTAIRESHAQPVGADAGSAR